MSVSPFDHPFLYGLLGDAETAALFSPEADIEAMLAFETTLAEAQAEASIIPAEAAAAIAAALGGLAPDRERLNSATARDGVVVPELVRQLRAAIGAPHAESLHVGATSQDVIDTGLMLRLKTVVEILDGRLAKLDAAFAELDRRFGRNRLMGRTRMQAALEIAVADRVRAWREPLARNRARLAAAKPGLLVVQFGGAAGTLDRFGDKGLALRAALARKLGLADAPQWHSQRDRLAEFAGLLSLIAGSLGKFGQDVALLAQAGDEISLSGGGGSSAMAHKQNPVAAEMLVALARFNAAQLAGMHGALVHEQERSGAAWTLEWLLLPPMIVATAAALRLAGELVANIGMLGVAPAE